MKLDEIFTGFDKRFDQILIDLGFSSSKKVSIHLDHARSPQEDPPSMFARQLPADEIPKVPQPLPDDQTQAWEHPKIPTEQKTTRDELLKNISEQKYAAIVYERNIRENSINHIDTLRRNPR